MATQNPFNSDIPQVAGAPICDPKTGLITQPWMYLIIALWRRTGGTLGVVTPTPGSDGDFSDILGPATGADDARTALSLEISQVTAMLQQSVSLMLAQERAMTLAAVENKISEMMFAPSLVQAPLPLPTMGVASHDAPLTEMTMGQF